MYCQNCGTEIIPGTNYCQHCGAPVAKTGRNAGPSDPKLVLTPHFFTPSMFTSMIGWQLLLTLWGAITFGIFGLLLINYYGWALSPWLIAIIAGAFFFVVTPIVYLFIMFNRYTKTRFFFFDDRLENWSGFIRMKKYVVKYNDIVELNMQSGVMQKFSGIGDIYLATVPVNRVALFAGGGIRLFDIPHPEDAFNRIKQLITKS